MTLPLTPARVSLNKRLAALLCMGVLGLAVFAVPQVRQKMLRNSGHDKLRELAWNPGDTYSSGRFFMWELYLQEAWNRPLIGHGGSSSYTFGMKANEWDHPHNELIRVFFDYGVVGLVLLGIPFLYTFRFALLDATRPFRLSARMLGRAPAADSSRWPSWGSRTM